MFDLTDVTTFALIIGIAIIGYHVQRLVQNYYKKNRYIVAHCFMDTPKGTAVIKIYFTELPEPSEIAELASEVFENELPDVDKPNQIEIHLVRALRYPYTRFPWDR
jgi:hypothetical protein